VDKSPHGFWKLAQNLLGTKQGTTSTYPLKNNEGKLITEDKIKCEEYRKLYETIYQAPEALPEYRPHEARSTEYNAMIKTKFNEIKPYPEEYDFDTNVSKENILSALRHTKNTAPGADEFSTPTSKTSPTPRWNIWRGSTS